MKPGKYRVVCPSCKKESLENNENFDPAKMPNGTMFRQIAGIKVRSPHDALESVKGQNFQCPLCMMPMGTVTGKLKLRCVKKDRVVLSSDAKEHPPKKAKPPKKKAKPEKKATKKRTAKCLKIGIKTGT